MPPDNPQHLTPQDLSRLLEVSLPGPQLRAAVRHLLTGCPLCLAQAECLGIPALLGLQRPQSPRR